MSTPEEFAEQFTQSRPAEDADKKVFNVGDRVVGLACKAPDGYLCGRIGGCHSENGPQVAGKVIEVDTFDDSIRVEITSSPEAPDLVGDKKWAYSFRQEYIDHAD
ncbi:hypothetical protein SEA_CAMERICO_78 [Gordonia phage Camerico]|nr:hypothetical protein SEA_CAMERICO_78 [Gordonia phage Camerico]